MTLIKMPNTRHAIHSGKTDVCRLLLDAGADPLAEDFKQQSVVL